MNKKVIIILVLVVIAVAAFLYFKKNPTIPVSQVSQPVATAKTLNDQVEATTKTYTDNQNLYEVQYPNTWTLTSENDVPSNTESTMFTSDTTFTPAHTNTENLEVMITVTNPNGSLDDYMISCKSGLSVNPTATCEEITLSQVPALMSISEFKVGLDDDYVLFKQTAIWTIKDNKLYAIVSKAPASGYQTYIDQVNAMINSFKFL